jgi:hypothetical protein
LSADTSIVYYLCLRCVAVGGANLLSKSDPVLPTAAQIHRDTHSRVSNPSPMVVQPLGLSTLAEAAADATAPNAGTTRTTPGTVAPFPRPHAPGPGVDQIEMSVPGAVCVHPHTSEDAVPAVTIPPQAEAESIAVPRPHAL